MYGGNNHEAAVFGSPRTPSSIAVFFTLYVSVMPLINATRVVRTIFPWEVGFDCEFLRIGFRSDR